MDLNGRNALITGGAVRVGRAITESLAGAGANVFIHYNRSAAPADELAKSIMQAGGVAAMGSSDLSDPTGATALMEQATSALGPISILVNSASGFPTDSFGDVTPDGWRAAQDLSLGSPLFLTQALANALPHEMDGAVINVTDVKTMRPYREHVSYMLAKGGVDTLTRAAALSLAPSIRVNAVALGVILPPPGEGADYVNALAAELPLQRVGGAGVVAETVLFLARNDFITGEIIRLDGGAHLV